MSKKETLFDIAERALQIAQRNAMEATERGQHLKRATLEAQLLSLGFKNYTISNIENITNEFFLPRNCKVELYFAGSVIFALMDNIDHIFDNVNRMVEFYPYAYIGVNGGKMQFTKLSLYDDDELLLSVYRQLSTIPY